MTGSAVSDMLANLPIPILRPNVVGEGLWLGRSVVVVVALLKGETLVQRIVRQRYGEI